MHELHENIIKQLQKRREGEREGRVSTWWGSKEKSTARLALLVSVGELISAHKQLCRDVRHLNYHALKYNHNTVIAATLPQDVC